MGEFASILCTGLLPSLGVEPASAGGIQDWIINSTYVPELSPDGGGIILGRTAAAPFVKAASFDFERFALAAKESHAMAELEWDKYPALGWPLLKLYYGGFFAAHAIMRSRGSGVIRLESAQAKHVNDLLGLYGVSGRKLSSGMFTFRRLKGPLDAANELSIALAPEQGGKGVHESFWREFCGYLEAEAKHAVGKGDSYSQSFLVFASELKDAIQLGGGGGGSVWFSSIRNQINYMHRHDTWLPSKRNSESYKSMSENPRPSGGAIQLNLSKSKTPIKAFIHVACYLCDTVNEIGDYVADRSTAGRAFGQKWRHLCEKTAVPRG